MSSGSDRKVAFGLALVLGPVAITVGVAVRVSGKSLPVLPALVFAFTGGGWLLLGAAVWGTGVGIGAKVDVVFLSGHGVGWA